MQRPSSDQLWQTPARAALPSPPPAFARRLPLEEQDTSYFAAAERISSFSINVMTAVLSSFCGVVQ